jgi:hypothetical protein
MFFNQGMAISVFLSVMGCTYTEVIEGGCEPIYQQINCLSIIIQRIKFVSNIPMFMA